MGLCWVPFIVSPSEAFFKEGNGLFLGGPEHKGTTPSPVPSIVSREAFKGRLLGVGWVGLGLGCTSPPLSLTPPHGWPREAFDGPPGSSAPGRQAPHFGRPLLGGGVLRVYLDPQTTQKNWRSPHKFGGETHFLREF